LITRPWTWGPRPQRAARQLQRLAAVRADHATECGRTPAGRQVAISNKITLNTETLAACPQLKLILVSATGTNNVDLEAARAHGITVSNCQGYGTPSVAQHTIMLLLNLDALEGLSTGCGRRQMAEAKQFCLLDHPIVELEGKTLGLLGHGELAAPSRAWPKPSACACSAQIPGRPARADRVPWMSCCRKWTR
jgi:glycerate dehydrogenase